MDLKQRIEKLNDLVYLISKGDQKAIEELKAVYLIALNKTLTKDCLNCRLRAFKEIMQLTDFQIQHVMKDQKFKIKAGHEPLHYKGDYYTNHNLTDEVAEQMVKEVPGSAIHFVNAPEVAEEEPKKKAKKKEPEPDEANESMTHVEDNPNIKE